MLKYGKLHVFSPMLCVKTGPTKSWLVELYTAVVLVLL